MTLIQFLNLLLKNYINVNKLGYQCITGVQSRREEDTKHNMHYQLRQMVIKLILTSCQQ